MTKKYLLIAFVMVAGFLPNAETADNSRIPSFAVPVLTGDYADPSIVKVEGTYYMTHSSFRYAPGLLIWKSTDLLNWTPVTYALQQYHGDVWAPDLVHHNGKFYIYYPNNFGKFVVMADTIEGPWSKPVKIECHGIDPGHVVGPDGKRYLHTSDGYVMPLTDDGLASAGKQEKVYDGWKYPEAWSTENFCLESPKLIFKDGTYHLFCAQGGTAGPSTSHMVVHARSKTPTGPWENSPYNPLVRTTSREEKWWSQGHGTVFEGDKGSWWMVYHAYNRDNLPLGRHTLLAQMEWTSDGWLKYASKSEPVRTETPVAISDDFSSKTLGMHWQFWDAYEPERVTLENASLTLKGKGKAAGESSPLCVMARQSRYEVTVDVEIDGNAQAGLLLFYNAKQYVGVAIDGKKVLAGEHGELRVLREPAERRMRLKIVNDFNDVTFFVNGKKVYNGIYVGGYSTHTFGGFLALRPAIYCSGEGRAIFRAFKVAPLK